MTRTAEEREELKRRKKNTPSHYRERLDRLRHRAEFLKRLIASKPEPERTWSRELAEISALEWAVATLEPWFAKEEPPALGVDGVRAPQEELTTPATPHEPASRSTPPIGEGPRLPPIPKAK